MSTVRIQVRRGTASEWTSANPTLAAGELGVETDTRKIKVGTGSTAWTSLAYIASDAPGITEIAQDAIDQALSMGSGLTKSYNDGTNTISLGIDSTVVALKSYVDDQITGLDNAAAADYVLLADVGNAGGPAKLDVDGNLLVPKSSIILEGSSADAFETTLTVTNPTEDRIITFPDASTTVVGTDITQTLSNKTLTTPIINGPTITATGQTPTIHGIYLPAPHNIIFEGATADDFETTLQAGEPTADRTITLPDASGTVALTSDLAEAAQDAVNSAFVTGSGITKVYDDNLNTITVGIDTGYIATTEALRSVVSSLNYHPAVEVATTAPLAATYTAGSADQANGTGIGATLTMNSNGAITIDGVALDVNSRVLVKDQANNIHNGIYTVTTVGGASTAAVLTRSLDYNNSEEKTPADVAQGDVVFVITGSTNLLKQFSQIYEGSNADKSIVIGTDNIDFTQISGTATITAGDGIVKTGDELRVDQDMFLTLSLAASTYLTSANATSTYLTQSNAADTYLTQANAGTTYLTQANAGTTYLTQANATSTYFAKNTDQIDNANIKTGAAIDKTKISGTAVTQADTGTVTSAMLAGSVANDKLANSTISGKALGTNLDALTIGTGLTGTSYNGSSAVTVAVDSTIATKTYADTAVSTHNSDTTNVHGIADTAELATKSYADGAVSTHSSDTTSVHGITDTAQLALLNAATQQFTGDMGITGDLVVTGDVTVNGGSFIASATTITIEDNLVQLAHENAGNTVDLGIIVGYSESSTAKHSGIVRDVSANKWKLFKGVTTEPSTTVDFTQGSLDDLELNNITAAGVVFTDGTQTKEGVPSRTPIISKTANYTLSAESERDSLIEVDSTGPVTITIPTNSAVAYPVGTTLDILGVNTGLITIAGDTGVTVNATPGLKLRTQWSSATLFKRAENSWVVYGDLKS